MILVRYEGKQISLANKIDSTPQTISQTIKTNGRLRSDTLEAIAKAYPQLNMRWFLTGEGESGLDQVATEPEAEEDPEKEMLKEELLSVYKDKTRMLEEKVQRMEQDIKEHCEGLAKRMGI